MSKTISYTDMRGITQTVTEDKAQQLLAYISKQVATCTTPLPHASGWATSRASSSTKTKSPQCSRSPTNSRSQCWGKS